MAGLPQPRTVLIVDDAVDVRELFVDLIQGLGLRVLEATNGIEALVHIKRERPELVLLDLNIPRVHGLQTLKQIRRFDPRIRVVVITGHADEALHRAALAVGAEAVLTKPFDLKSGRASGDVVSEGAGTTTPGLPPPQRGIRGGLNPSRPVWRAYCLLHGRDPRFGG